MSWSTAPTRRRVTPLTWCAPLPVRSVRLSSDGRKTDLYPSQATLERTWSDGSVDYACAWEGCDYTADKPRSTSSHYRIHVMDSGVRVDTTPTVFDAKVDGYRTVRVAHLAKEIEAALDSIEDGSVYDTP